MYLKITVTEVFISNKALLCVTGTQHLQFLFFEMTAQRGGFQ